MAHKVVPQKIYILIFVTLLMLTGVTVDVAFFNAGWLNLYIALAIATSKATLVLLFFMHLRYAERLNWVFVAAGFAWLFLLVGIIASDFVSRSWLPVAGF